MGNFLNTLINAELSLLGVADRDWEAEARLAAAAADEGQQGPDDAPAFTAADYRSAAG